MEEDLQKTTMIEIMDDEEEERPAKKKKKRPAVFSLLLVVLLLASAAGAGYSGYQIYSTLKERSEGTGAYSRIEANVAPEDPGSGRIRIELDFEELASINPDIIGWLIQDTSVINYPVVQHTDNEYYLNHIFTGEWNHMGCVFTDSAVAGDFSERNTPLYAHGRKDGTMFGTLEKYESQAYYDEHQSFILVTRDGRVFLLEPFAGSINDATKPFLKVDFASEEEFVEYVKHWLRTSTFQSNNTVRTGDRLVTMLTCSDDFQDARYALFCTMRDVSDQYEIVAPGKDR